MLTIYSSSITPINNAVAENGSLKAHQHNLNHDRLSAVCVNCSKTHTRFPRTSTGHVIVTSLNLKWNHSILLLYCGNNPQFQLYQYKLVDTSHICVNYGIISKFNIRSAALMAKTQEISPWHNVFQTHFVQFPVWMNYDLENWYFKTVYIIPTVVLQTFIINIIYRYMMWSALDREKKYLLHDMIYLHDRSYLAFKFRHLNNSVWITLWHSTNSWWYLHK